MMSVVDMPNFQSKSIRGMKNWMSSSINSFLLQFQKAKSKGNYEKS